MGRGDIFALVRLYVLICLVFVCYISRSLLLLFSVMPSLVIYHTACNFLLFVTVAVALLYFSSTRVLLAEGSTDVNFNMIYHKGTNFTKKIVTG